MTRRRSAAAPTSGMSYVVMCIRICRFVGVCSGSCDSEDAEEGGVEMEEVSVTTAGREEELEEGGAEGTGV